MNNGKHISSPAKKSYWREVLALLMLLLAMMFFRSERRELSMILPHLRTASPGWLAAALLVTCLCMLFEAGMYRQAFAAIRLRFGWVNALMLFLKRNFISVFLPAGGVSSLAYSPSQVRKAGFSKVQVHQASALFGFAGLLTVWLAGLPVVVYTVSVKRTLHSSWWGLGVLLALIAGIFFIVRSYRRRGPVFRLAGKAAPSFTPAVDELLGADVQRAPFAGVVAFSLGVEACGMLHVYLAMLALGFPASFTAAAAAYVIAVLMMIISPFLRGLGAVELSLVFVLGQFGYTPVQALSITVLYRVFEFWLPLAGGLLAYAWKGKDIFLRLAPALLTFALGMVNIISVITPPLHGRLRLLQEFIPLGAIHASGMLVLLTGLSLLLTSAFLFRGLRNAWALAVILALVSVAGHLFKALDYEEAAVAAVTLAVLLGTASQYRQHGARKSMALGVKTAMLVFAGVVVFGFTSFYFIDVKHFGVDFTWRQALVHTLKSFLLVEDSSLQPVTRFGREFVWIIRVLGFLTWGFLLYTFVRPGRGKAAAAENAREKALQLVTAFGDSPNDYFKTYADKQFFFSARYEAFVAYKISGGFAVALEGPVAAESERAAVLEEFGRYCRTAGLKPVFYRVGENSLLPFRQLGKRYLMIGQEALLDVEGFSLQGKDRKSLRNGLSALQKKGCRTEIHVAPHAPALLQALKHVSDEWLLSTGLKEQAFSQGIFDEAELAAQDVVALYDQDGRIQAFLNVIPDYVEGECTYDMIRKTPAAPPGAMDALIVKLVEYAAARQRQYVNLGMAPMSGIEEPGNAAEQLIKMAADSVKGFRHFKGLREFKEKYASVWENVYLVYDNEFDLLRLPFALKNVMKP